MWVRELVGKREGGGRERGERVKKRKRKGGEREGES
jgi:hypothetical protein